MSGYSNVLQLVYPPWHHKAVAGDPSGYTSVLQLVFPVFHHQGTSPAGGGYSSVLQLLSPAWHHKKVLVTAPGGGYFANRYFPNRYFAKRYFPHNLAGSAGVASGYFPRRYFANRYFPRRYFPHTLADVPESLTVLVLFDELFSGGMMREIKFGSTGVSAVIRIRDAADGTPKTNITYQSAGLDLWYRREGESVVPLTEAFLGSLSDTHTPGGIIHINSGYYRVDVPDAAFVVGADGVLVGGNCTGMDITGAYFVLVNHDPQEAIADIKEKTDTIGSGNITIVSPVGHGGSITIIQGDSYQSTEGRQIDFTNTDRTWPTLTGATVNFSSRKGSDTFTKAMTIPDDTGTTKTVRLQLTSAETDARREGQHSFQVRATLTNGNIVTLVNGTMVVRRPNGE